MHVRRYSTGTEILDRIAVIEAEQEKLVTSIKEVHVGSFNDSGYRNTAISSDELKSLLRGRLHEERKALIEKFNVMFTPRPAVTVAVNPKARKRSEK